MIVPSTPLAAAVIANDSCMINHCTQYPIVALIYLFGFGAMFLMILLSAVWWLFGKLHYKFFPGKWFVRTTFNEIVLRRRAFYDTSQKCWYRKWMMRNPPRDREIPGTDPRSKKYAKNH